MQREIKFRIWDKITHSYLRDEFAADPLGYDLEKLRFFYKIEDKSVKVTDRYIFEQYTGLKDKNGIEIYDGDIVTLHYAIQPEHRVPPESFGIYEIVWKTSSFYIKQHKHNWFATHFGDPKVNLTRPKGTPPFVIIEELPLETFRICKVIGNIFENPELLCGK